MSDSFRKRINMVQYSKIIFAVFASLLFSVALFAQRDTTKRQVVDITSSYKPVLRSVSKINMVATQFPVDTSRLKIKYNVPAQNLFYSYQPVSLRPLAYEQDTILSLAGNNFIKAGIGNYTTPFLSARVSLLNSEKAIVNLYGDYISSKGKIKYQDYSKLNLKATGSYFTNRHEFYGGVSANLDNNYLYGYDHKIYNYNKSDIQQQFTNISTNIGLRNIRENLWGINYNPSFKINFFNLKNRASENELNVNVPFEKKINDLFRAKLGLTIDYSGYKTIGNMPHNFSIKNSIVQVSPELVYNDLTLLIHGSVIPVVDNKSFYILPNVYGEVKLTDKTFLLQAGLVGKITQNNFYNQTNINPYLVPDTVQHNTREVELYGGIKSKLGNHLMVSAKAGFVHFYNFQLYKNDTTDFKSFQISNEPTMDALRIHADLSYLYQEKFSFTSGITINQYAGVKQNIAAFGVAPLEFTAAMRYVYSKKLVFKSDMYAFSGVPYLLKNNVSRKQKGGFDLSAGAEYKIGRRVSAWLDINNILNDKYQRWYNYPVYGINVLAGVKYTF